MPDWHYVHKELRRPGVTLLLLWLEYKEAHPDDGYSYSQFCVHYRAWQGHLDLVMRQEHRAGEKLFVDFPGQRLPIFDRRSGEVALEAELFVAVLGASNYLYAEAVASQGSASWLTAHVHAFEALGCLPRVIVPDNLASAVKKAHRYEPDINASYQEMAAHYGVAIIPARPRKPRDKAKVENGVLLAERWVLARLRNRRFYSLAEANAAIGELVAWLNDRPFKKMPGSRRQLFEELERPVMAPLPATRYSYGAWKTGVKVNIDYHIEDTAYHHYYSVPYQLVGQRVDVRTGAVTVEVFYSGRRVASHLRSFVPGTAHHRPGAHARLSPPPRRVDTVKGHRLGRKDRPQHGGPGQRDHGHAHSPRAGLPLLLGHHPPGRALRGGAPRSRLCPGLSRQGAVLPLGRVHPVPRPRQPAAWSSPREVAPASPEPARPRVLPMKGTTAVLTNTTIDGLHTLRLPGMARGLLEQREHPDYDALGFEERLAMLVDRELTERQNRRLDRMLKAAHLRLSATHRGHRLRPAPGPRTRPGPVPGRSALGTLAPLGRHHCRHRARQNLYQLRPGQRRGPARPFRSVLTRAAPARRDLPGPRRRTAPQAVGHLGPHRRLGHRRLLVEAPCPRPSRRLARGDRGPRRAALDHRHEPTAGRHVARSTRRADRRRRDLGQALGERPPHRTARRVPTASPTRQGKGLNRPQTLPNGGQQTKMTRYNATRAAQRTRLASPCPAMAGSHIDEEVKTRG